MFVRYAEKIFFKSTFFKAEAYYTVLFLIPIVFIVGLAYVIR